MASAAPARELVDDLAPAEQRGERGADDGGAEHAGGVGRRLDDLERLLVGGEQHAVALDAARRADRLAMAVLQVDRGPRLQQLVVYRHSQTSMSSNVATAACGETGAWRSTWAPNARQRAAIPRRAK